MFCTDEYSLAVIETTRFGLFSPEIPSIIYYSHFTAIIVTLLLSFFVFAKNRTLATKILVAISISFSTLAILDILLWTQIHVGLVMLLWSFWLTLFILIFFLSSYFLYAFIYKRDVPFTYKLGAAITLLVVEFFSSTTLNLEYFDLAYCEAAEGPLMINAVFGLSFLILIGTALFGALATRKITDTAHKKRSLLATIGISAFLLVFSVATYMTSIIGIFFADGSFVFVTEQYGYYGMTIFIGFLSYIIVRYQAFQIKLFASSALVAALVILIATQFLFVRSETSIVLSGVTLLIALVFGYLLIKSVKREVKQREEIERLADKLKKANKRLKEIDQMKSEFVSIASHQLRSPLTSIRGYASMLVEGSYGKIPAKARDALSRIAESSRFMALTVEDFLNVSRIEAGKMKYEYSDFDMKELAEKVTDDVRQAALQKGLLIVFRSDCTSKCVVNADLGKVRQVLHNLIDNAMKYTPKGSITVVAHDDKRSKKMSVSIIDTGVGMDKETQNQIFEKFVRAKNANKVNVTGAGLGLFVAKQMIEEMGGQIVPKSDGAGKGSTFTIELPLVR